MLKILFHSIYLSCSSPNAPRPMANIRVLEYFRVVSRNGIRHGSRIPDTKGTEGHDLHGISPDDAMGAWMCEGIPMRNLALHGRSDSTRRKVIPVSYVLSNF